MPLGKLLQLLEKLMQSLWFDVGTEKGFPCLLGTAAWRWCVCSKTLIFRNTFRRKLSVYAEARLYEEMLMNLVNIDLKGYSSVFNPIKTGLFKSLYGRG